MLVINTAFMNANLALKTAEGKVCLKDIDSKSKHSENVLKTIDEMCKEMGVDILDVKTVAVVTGPGSFTGLRIGTAIAQALGCVNENLKFISISSLELMAYIIVKNKLCDGNFVCVLNALSDLFFVANFDKNGIKLKEERMIDKQEFSAITDKVFALEGDFKADFQTVQITGEDLLDFASLLAKEKKFVKADMLLPVYLRASQAEDNLLKKSKKD